MPSAYYQANYNEHGVRLARCTCTLTSFARLLPGQWIEYETIWQRDANCPRHQTIDELLDAAGICTCTIQPAVNLPDPIEAAHYWDPDCRQHLTDPNED